MIADNRSTGFIDVRKLIDEVSVEEMCRSAEQFFANRIDWDSLQAKPFAEIEESPELLICFAHVVRGLKLLPDMTLLDFGAGTCWTSHFLSQLGLKVIALDVSVSALKLGRRLYGRHPLIGHRPKPQFLLFDGVTIDLPNASVDRISCWEALHHVPNANRVISEMGRVLKPGGIAGFSEPGPEHSKSEQSQFEMRTNGVIENDVNIHEIWDTAKEAGFTNMKVAVFNAEPVLLDLPEFENYVNGIDNGERLSSETRRQMEQRRLFFLYKGDAARPPDSRSRDGLRCELEVTSTASRVVVGKSLQLHIIAKNIGDAVWLPTPEAAPPWWQHGPLKRFGRQPHMGPDRIPPRVGGVRLGIQLFTDAGELLDIDYFRYHLTPGAGREIGPGKEVQLAPELPVPPAGRYILHCDLVSEGVGWFEYSGSTPVKLPIEVV